MKLSRTGLLTAAASVAFRPQQQYAISSNFYLSARTTWIRTATILLTSARHATSAAPTSPKKGKPKPFEATFPETVPTANIKRESNLEKALAAIKSEDAYTLYLSLSRKRSPELNSFTTNDYNKILHNLRGKQVFPKASDVQSKHSLLAAAVHRILSAMDAAGRTPNEKTYNVILDVYSFAGHLEGCDEVLETMKKLGRQTNTIRVLRLLSNACRTSGNTIRGEQIVDAINKDFPDSKAAISKALQNLMVAYAKNGNATKAKEIIDVLRGEHGARDAANYKHLLNAHIFNNDIDSACDVIDTLCKELNTEVAPVGFYTTIIHASSRIGNAAVARKIFNKLQDGYPELTTAFTLSHELEICAVEGDSVGAWKAYCALARNETRMLNTNLRWLAELSAKEGEIVPLDTWAKTGVEGDLDIYSTYHHLVRAYRILEDATKAEAVVRAMEAKNWKVPVNVYNELLMANLNCKDIVALRRILEEMEGKGLKGNKLTWLTVLPAFDAAGMKVGDEAVQRVMEKVLELGNRLEALVQDLEVRLGIEHPFVREIVIRM